jgi:hypothetical protein
MAVAWDCHCGRGGRVVRGRCRGDGGVCALWPWMRWRVKVPMRNGDATRQEAGRYAGWKRWVFMFPGMLIVAMEVVSVASAVV